MAGSRRRWKLVAAAGAVGGLVALQWAINAGSPPLIDPSGVDGLSSPAVAAELDLSAEVDHPWFPFADHTRWVYRAEDATGKQRERVVQVEGTEQVDGVPVTRVTVDLLGAGEFGEAWTHDYAQDAAGNVWEVDGGAATLAAPAQPRRGDGHLRSGTRDEAPVTWRHEGPESCPDDAALTPQATQGCSDEQAWLIVQESPSAPSSERQEIVMIDGVGEVIRMHSSAFGAGSTGAREVLVELE